MNNLDICHFSWIFPYFFPRYARVFHLQKSNFLNIFRLSLHPTGTPERIPLQNASSFAHHRRSNGSGTSAASGDRFLKLPGSNNSSTLTTTIHQNGSSPSHSTNGKNGSSPRTVFVTIHENEVTTKLLNSPNGSSASHHSSHHNMPIQA